MNIPVKEHGEWVIYTPETPPGEAPPGTGFCKRTSDGEDWYAYQKKSPFINTGTAKCTIRNNLLVTVKRDESALFPEGSLLGEFETTEENVQEAYGGWTYDPVTKTISWVKPPSPGGPTGPDPIDVAHMANQRITRGVLAARDEYNLPVAVGRAPPMNPAEVTAAINRLERTLKELCSEMMKLKGISREEEDVEFND